MASNCFSATTARPWRAVSILAFAIVTTAILFTFSHKSAIHFEGNFHLPNPFASQVKSAPRPPELLEDASSQPFPYLPYPDYNSTTWKRRWRGQYVACNGPDGLPYNESLTHIAHARHYYSVVPVISSQEVLGLDGSVCFDSERALGPYGGARSGTATDSNTTDTTSRIDWSQVRWRDLQDQCLASNQNRYAPHARATKKPPDAKDLPSDSEQLSPQSHLHSTGRSFHHRTALIIRSWTGYRYTEDELQSIRSLIVDLNLLSGGEYQVFLFVQVKDDRPAMWTDPDAYRRIIAKNVPRELRDITILWDERVLKEWYPDIGDWQVYWHQFMPLQWFSKIHPEFDFVWNWEVDARCIGNHYHVLGQIAKFAQQAPRKYLWERNARFYIPAAHGTYDQWLKDTHDIIESTSASGDLDVSWGAQPYDESVQQPIGPIPPSELHEDNFEWGVGEEADLITLLPIWDPRKTYWTFRDKIFNFLPGVRPHFTPTNPLDEAFTHPSFANISRRAFINTVARFSKRQLHAMHLENRAGRDMAAEMWPATVALQHGLKAVHVPHPIWAEDDPPAQYVDDWFNANGGKSGRWGSGPDSIYNQDREWRFQGFTWFFNARFPRKLYQEWLKLRADDASETQNFGSFARIVSPDGERKGLCLPQMLLHPVKNV